MPWTSPQDVIDRWVGDGAPDPTGVLPTLIGDAEAILAAQYPTLADRIAAGDLDVAVVQLVVSRMVMRVLRNPDGSRQVTETVGPFSRNRTYSGDTPGSLWLTDEERSMLGDTSRRQRAYTVTTAPPGTPVDYLDELWWADGGG